MLLSLFLIVLMIYYSPFKSLGARLALGAVINIFIGGMGRLHTANILSERGYHEIAERYYVFNWEVIFHCGIMGIFYVLLFLFTDEITKKIKGKESKQQRDTFLALPAPDSLPNEANNEQETTELRQEESLGLLGHIKLFFGFGDNKQDGGRKL